MSEAKHTPGPWEVKHSGGYQKIIGPGQRPQQPYSFIATLNRYRGTEPTADANARLIAAAPEMLDALRAQHEAIDILLAMVIGLDREFMPTKSKIWPMLLQGNAAIAKATGNGQSDTAR